MKKLITLLAVFGFATTAMADDHGKQSGSFRINYNNVDNADLDDDVNDRDQSFNQRLIWAPHFKVSDNLSVHTTFVHSAQWGLNADQVPGDGQPNTAQPEENVLIVNEAYANWMISDESMMRIGRGSFTMADGRIVSTNEWEQIRKAFDGVMYTHDHEMARASVFGVRGAKDVSSGIPNAAGTFYGLSLDFKSLPEFLKTANFHYITVKRDQGSYLVNGTATALVEEKTDRIGVTLGGDTSGVDYNVTYAMYSGETDNNGTSTDVDANMMDITVGYSMPDMMNLRVSVQHHSDTGQDGGSDNTRYSGFHYDTHNNAGLMDIVGYGNLTFNRVGVTFDPKDDINVGFDYYMFTLTEDTDGYYAPNATTASTTVANEDDLGTEMDIWVQKNYSSNFNTRLRYGTFAGGDALGSGLDDVTQVYLEGNMTF